MVCFPNQPQAKWYCKLLAFAQIFGPFVTILFQLLSHYLPLRLELWPRMLPEFGYDKALEKFAILSSTKLLQQNRAARVPYP